MAIHDEIEAFFETYVAAFRARDAEAVSQLWEEVALFPSPKGNFLMDRGAFREHCVGLLDFYRQQGVVTPTGKLLSAEPLFPNVVQARMAYQMLGEDGDSIAQWQHVYILRKTDRWRVSLTIPDDEIAAWAARLEQS